MAITQKRLFGPDALTTTTTATKYTVPASTKTIVKQVILCNATANAVTATVHCVPSGSSAAASNLILNAVALAANETIMLSMSLVMTTGDTIAAGCSTNSAVTMTVNGVEEA